MEKIDNDRLSKKMLNYVGRFADKHIYTSMVAGVLAFGSVCDTFLSCVDYVNHNQQYQTLQKIPERIRTIKEGIEQESFSGVKLNIDSLQRKFWYINGNSIIGYNEDISDMSKPITDFLSESKDISKKKEYRTSLEDPKFRKELVTALDETVMNYESYNGSLDGKFHYNPLTTSILGFSLLGAIPVSYLFQRRRKRKKTKNKG